MTHTSTAARLSINTMVLEQMVYEVVKSTKDRGAISDELRHMFPGLAYSSVTARFAALEKQGRIYRPGVTRQGDSGRSQMVMWADTHRQRASNRLWRAMRGVITP